MNQGSRRQTKATRIGIYPPKKQKPEFDMGEYIVNAFLIAREALHEYNEAQLNLENALYMMVEEQITETASDESLIASLVDTLLEPWWKTQIRLQPFVIKAQNDNLALMYEIYGEFKKAEHKLYRADFELAKATS